MKRVLMLMALLMLQQVSLAQPGPQQAPKDERDQVAPATAHPATSHIDFPVAATSTQSQVLVAQMPTDSRVQPTPPPILTANQGSPTEPHAWRPIEIFLTAGMLVFTILVLVLEVWIVVRAKTPWSPQSILKLMGLTMILSFSIVLIAAGYDKDQMSPVMALLGAVAGYLLGHNEPDKTAG